MTLKQISKFPNIQKYDFETSERRWASGQIVSECGRWLVNVGERINVTGRQATVGERTDASEFGRAGKPDMQLGERA